MNFLSPEKWNVLGETKGKVKLIKSKPINGSTKTCSSLYSLLDKFWNS